MRRFNTKPAFPLGELKISDGITNRGIDPGPLLRRHQGCDWSEMPEGFLELNQQALANGEAILSQYDVTTPMKKSVRVTIMTEDDRSYTVIYTEGEDAPAG